MKTPRRRLALLCLCLAAAMLMFSTDGLVRAQDSSREDTVVKLAGKKLRVDKSGRLRPISSAEAREMVATLTSMTTRTEVSTTAAASGAQLTQFAGFDHVLVARPNGDGTSDVRCVSSVDEAVSFFDQQSAAKEQE